MFLAACGASTPAPPATALLVTDPGQAPPGAGEVPAADFAWQVEIVQAEQVHPDDIGDVLLARAPFAIRVRLPQPMAVKLNASTSDENFVLLQPGFTFTDDCALALCTGMDVAEEPLNPDRWLAVDSLSTHYLYYLGPNDHRWSRVAVDANGAVFERDITLLNDEPVEQFTAPALYLLLMVNVGDPATIEPGELKKITLIFN
jgi:hypothetical protein